MTTGEERKINYQRLVKAIENHLRDYNIGSVISEVGYALMVYGIYFHVDPFDVVLAYCDSAFHGIVVTFVLKTGVAVKVKIQGDEKLEYVNVVDVWYVTE
jgi:hypothetical protein